jgi:RsiW-degrading membrane proteinase PrsW (M82 family)
MNPGGQWYYLVGSDTRGPVPQQQIIDLVKSGGIPPSTMVAAAGWQQWQPASTVFADQLAAPAPVAAPAPAAAAPPTLPKITPPVQPQPQPQPVAQPQPRPQPVAMPQPQPQPQRPFTPGVSPVAPAASAGPAPAPTAIAAVQLRCVAGPDTGKVFVVSAQEVTLGKVAGIGQSDPGVQDQHVMLSWQNNMLNFRTGPGASIVINGMMPPQGALMLGQQFQLGASTWQVSNQSFTLGGLLDSVGSRLNSLASTEKLEGFSLGEMFSEVFKKRTQEETDEYFICGTSKTTPPIESAITGWPKPWFFMRVLIFMGLIYIGFLFAWKEFTNMNLLPGLMMMGSLVFPLATVILFFELNTPRNISFHYTLGLLCVGGVVSLFISLIGFEISSLSSFIGPPAAGIVEEIGKLLTVIIVARNLKYKYILNGLLFGAAVGAGFAVFESAGYAFNAFIDPVMRVVSGRVNFQGNILTYAGGAMTTNIVLRGLLSPFCHVAWTAIAAGALWRVKGDKPFNVSMLTNPLFFKAFLIPMGLHMIWNFSYIPSPFWIKHIILGVIGWFIVFGIVQQGLKQVRQAQLEQVKEELSKTQSVMAAVTGRHLAPTLAR